MQRKWLLQRTNAEFIDYLAASAAITPAFAQILINRGAKTPEAVEAFIRADRQSMEPPEALKGMDDAVRRILVARDKGQTILVHGDYDVDGATATSIIITTLKALGIRHEYFIPNRFEHGYGFNPEAVDMAASAEAALILTVDCGITNFEAAAAARKIGIDVIVTDHHEPVVENGKLILPDAVAIVNPKLPGSGMTELSGAGVALKLSEALVAATGAPLDTNSMYDLAALGSLADSVPLTGDNRTIVKLGLPGIHNPWRKGLIALREVAGINGRPMRSGMIAFTLVPRMNAAGRLGSASEVVELLCTEDEATAMQIAKSLDRKNSERQGIEESVYSQALAMIEQRGVGPAIVLASEGWHEGVLGIVASKLAERFERPSFVMNINGDVAKGSARSAGGVDIHRALAECIEHMVGFGGHKMAAGLRVKAAELSEFEAMLCRVIEQQSPEEEPVLTIDAAVSLRDLSFRLAEELAQLEPFGVGNPEPVLGARGLEPLAPRVVGKNHLKMRLRTEGGGTIDAIGFGMGDMLSTVESAAEVDAAFSLGINEWEGRKTLQVSLKGLRY